MRVGTQLLELGVDGDNEALTRWVGVGQRVVTITVANNVAVLAVFGVQGLADGGLVGIYLAEQLIGPGRGAHFLYQRFQPVDVIQSHAAVKQAGFTGPAEL